MTLTVQWQPPQYDGEAPVNYTITVSQGVGTFTTNVTSFPVAVPYNVLHDVSIVATNCNGSSSVVMVTIRIGMLWCSVSGNSSAIVITLCARVKWVYTIHFVSFVWV